MTETDEKAVMSVISKIARAYDEGHTDRPQDILILVTNKDGEVCSVFCRTLKVSDAPDR